MNFQCSVDRKIVLGITLSVLTFTTVPGDKFMHCGYMTCGIRVGSPVGANLGKKQIEYQYNTGRFQPSQNSTPANITIEIDTKTTLYRATCKFLIGNLGHFALEFFVKSGLKTAGDMSYDNFRVATCQGKVREKQNFLQVRELSGNFEKMSGNFGHLTNVREMSGNFVMTIKFFQK